MTLISSCAVVLGAAFFAGLLSSARRPLLALILTLASAGPYFSALLYGEPLDFDGTAIAHRRSTQALVERAVLKLAPVSKPTTEVYVRKDTEPPETQSQSERARE